MFGKLLESEYVLLKSLRNTLSQMWPTVCELKCLWLQRYISALCHQTDQLSEPLCNCFSLMKLHQEQHSYLIPIMAAALGVGTEWGVLSGVSDSFIYSCLIKVSEVFVSGQNMVKCQSQFTELICHMPYCACFSTYSLHVLSVKCDFANP